MKISKIKYGKFSLIKVSFDNFHVSFCNLGASIYSIEINKDKILMTTKNFDDFVKPYHYHGKTIGRVANRTKGNTLLIDNKNYTLENNEGENVLHGGLHALSNQKFSYNIRKNKDNCKVIFSYFSPSGESGYPGNLYLKVIYTVSKDFSLTTNYQYFADKKTPVSLTNHAYFTLGDDSLNNLKMFINSEKFLHPNPKTLLAEEIRDARDEMCFLKSKSIVAEIDSDYLVKSRTNGYDHYFYFKEVNKTLSQFELKNDKYCMRVYTNYPGVQIYTDNYKDNVKYYGTNNTVRRGIAVEFSMPHIETIFVEPNKKYNYFTKYVFQTSNLDCKKVFENEFNTKPKYHVSSGGRVEMIGNHTDHNHGLCCAFTCNLAIKGFLSPRQDNKIVCISKGYSTCNIDLNDLDKKHEEGISAGLIRGVARYFKNLGFKIGGFNLVTESTIFPGAGVSSSAAFETLIGQIFNVLFNGNKVDKLTIAKAGQYAENFDFGKKSGLLDQIGTGYSNMSFIDFKDIENPIVEKLVFPFNDLKFVIVNTGGSHANLTDLYSSIPEDMWHAAQKMGHNFLRECNIEELNNAMLTTMEKNRALHFFNENLRVLKLKEAIQTKNKQMFLDCINESRQSSCGFLKNMMVEDKYIGSPQEACDKAMEILGTDGACRINGGGFAGSIICVVPDFKLREFVDKMSQNYGRNNVVEVHIDKIGPTIEKI